MRSPFSIAEMLNSGRFTTELPKLEIRAVIGRAREWSVDPGMIEGRTAKKGIEKAGFRRGAALHSMLAPIVAGVG